MPLTIGNNVERGFNCNQYMEFLKGRPTHQSSLGVGALHIEIGSGFWFFFFFLHDVIYFRFD